jgi:hypothetical protein
MCQCDRAALLRLLHQPPAAAAAHNSSPSPSPLNAGTVPCSLFSSFKVLPKVAGCCARGTGAAIQRPHCQLIIRGYKLHITPAQNPVKLVNSSAGSIHAVHSQCSKPGLAPTTCSELTILNLPINTTRYGQHKSSYSVTKACRHSSNAGQLCTLLTVAASTSATAAAAAAVHSTMRFSPSSMIPRPSHFPCLLLWWCHG